VGILAHKDPKRLMRMIHNAKYHPGQDLNFCCGHKLEFRQEAIRQPAKHKKLLYWALRLSKSQPSDGFNCE